MRIRQMAFSSRLKAHKHLLTLETLAFLVEYLEDRNARQAALRSGIPETYASRYGQWLKKRPLVISALERELDESELRKLRKSIADINSQMEVCRGILGFDE